jgi:hypothetical protein
VQPGLGNVGRNTILTAGPRDWSLTVQGMFKMPLGRVEQQALRLGFFKAFNHPNLGINNVGNTQATTSRTPTSPMWVLRDSAGGRLGSG